MAITPKLRRIFKSLVMNPVARDRIDVYDPGYLVIADEKIERLSRDDPRSQFPSAEFVDLSDKLVLPGFIDTHVHLPQFAIMGIGSGELLAWLNDYTYPEEARFANPQYAAKVSAMFFDEMIANGTTTAAIYASVHEEATDIAFSVAKTKGVRAFIGKVMMDRNSPEALQEDTDDSVAASLRLFEKWDGAEDGRLRYIFAPRFAGSCSMDLMKRTAEMARERGAFVQSHLSENPAELEWVQKIFPEYRSYAAIYDAAGLLGPRSIMAHCIHLSSEEIDVLAARGAKVAFCPYSNRMLRSGTMPYRRLRDAGLHIALGTDIAGGASLSMLRQMGEALMVSGDLSVIEAFYMATLGGAAALEISDRVGNLATGKDADFVVLDYKQVDPAREVAGYDEPELVLSRLSFRGDRHLITEVYLRGRRVYF